MLALHRNDLLDGDGRRHSGGGAYRVGKALQT